jgi:hypothetical protein
MAVRFQFMVKEDDVERLIAAWGACKTRRNWRARKASRSACGSRSSVRPGTQPKSELMTAGGSTWLRARFWQGAQLRLHRREAPHAHHVRDRITKALPPAQEHVLDLKAP